MTLFVENLTTSEQIRLTKLIMNSLSSSNNIDLVQNSDYNAGYASEAISSFEDFQECRANNDFKYNTDSMTTILKGYILNYLGVNENNIPLEYLLNDDILPYPKFTIYSDGTLKARKSGFVKNKTYITIYENDEFKILKENAISISELLAYHTAPMSKLNSSKNPFLKVEKSRMVFESRSYNHQDNVPDQFQIMAYKLMFKYERHMELIRLGRIMLDLLALNGDIFIDNIDYIYELYKTLTNETFTDNTEHDNKNEPTKTADLIAIKLNEGSMDRSQVNAFMSNSVLSNEQFVIAVVNNKILNTKASALVLYELMEKKNNNVLLFKQGNPLNLEDGIYSLQTINGELVYTIIKQETNEIQVVVSKPLSDNVNNVHRSIWFKYETPTIESPTIKPLSVYDNTEMSINEIYKKLEDENDSSFARLPNSDDDLTYNGLQLEDIINDLHIEGPKDPETLDLFNEEENKDQENDEPQTPIFDAFEQPTSFMEAVRNRNSNKIRIDDERIITIPLPGAQLNDYMTLLQNYGSKAEFLNDENEVVGILTLHQ